MGVSMFGGRGIYIHPADGIALESRRRIRGLRRHANYLVRWKMLYIGFSPTDNAGAVSETASYQQGYPNDLYGHCFPLRGRAGRERVASDRRNAGSLRNPRSAV